MSYCNKMGSTTRQMITLALCQTVSKKCPVYFPLGEKEEEKKGDQRPNEEEAGRVQESIYQQFSLCQHSTQVLSIARLYDRDAAPGSLCLRNTARPPRPAPEQGRQRRVKNGPHNKGVNQYTDAHGEADLS